MNGDNIISFEKIKATKEGKKQADDMFSSIIMESMFMIYIEYQAIMRAIAGSGQNVRETAAGILDIRDIKPEQKYAFYHICKSLAHNSEVFFNLLDEQFDMDSGERLKYGSKADKILYSYNKLLGKAYVNKFIKKAYMQILRDNISTDAIKE